MATLTYRVVGQGLGRVRAALDGELTTSVWTERLRDYLEEHYVNDGVRVIEIGLEGVDLIDLEGVATLLTLAKEAERRGKQLVIRSPADRVRRRLQMLGVLELLEGRGAVGPSPEG
jgi:anti-anti-sigma factor